MAYLGNAPAEKYISFERQVFTIVNSQTAYTLDHSVTNENDIRLVVNNVVQEPGSGKAYTASGTTLTLSAALTNGTDEMYCVFLGRAVGTVNPPAASVDTAQLAADAVTGAKIADDAISDEHLDPTAITGQTAETTIASDDLILLSDTSASGALKKMTQANFVSGVGGNNTPAFCAHLGSNQQISAGATTKIQFNVEKYDTDNSYDNSTNYRFTIPSAGKYFFYFNVTFSNMVDDRCVGYFRKNGNSAALGRQESYSNRTGADVGLNGSYSDDFSANDYMEVYVDGGQSDYPARAETVGETFFGGFKLIT